MARVGSALSLSLLLVGAASASLLASRAGYGASDRLPDPERGTLTNDVYVNRYFDLVYPLPPGWKPGLDGPPPSNGGYYVLSTPAPEGDATGTMLIAAQDMFFAAQPEASAIGMLEDLRRNAGRTPGLSVEKPPRSVTIAGRGFARLDLGGVGLSRVVLATELRCHVVIFTFASPDPALLERLVTSLDRLSLPVEDAGAGASSAPVCIENYASDATIRRKVAPAPVAPYFYRIPVRIIVGADGKVAHVHVIRAFPGQAKSIADALGRWEFKPYEVQGRPVEVETGIQFEFKPPGR
jgi:hypothetical protein